jgi:hypothetical protein
MADVSDCPSVHKDRVTHCQGQEGHNGQHFNQHEEYVVSEGRMVTVSIVWGPRTVPEPEQRPYVADGNELKEGRQKAKRGRRDTEHHDLPVYPYHDGQIPRVAGSETSALAADSQEETIEAKQARILELIRNSYSGLTDDDVERRTGWRHQTVSARRRELVLAGFVTYSGTRRRTSSGRLANVWISRD